MLFMNEYTHRVVIYRKFKIYMVEFEELDTKLFIEEIKKYPKIWNVAAEDYHNQIMIK